MPDETIATGMYREYGSPYEPTGGKQPDKSASPEGDALDRWAKEVKEAIDKGEAYGCINARTNYISIVDGGRTKIRPRIGGAYSDVALRGVTERQASDIYGAVELYDRVNDKRAKIHGIDGGTLYLTDTTADEIDKTIYATKERKAEYKRTLSGLGRKRILEFRYRQLDIDESAREGRKHVLLVVPDNLADRMHDMVESGADPKEIHDAIANVFTTPETKSYFDAGIVRFEGENVAGVVRPTSDQPPFEKVVTTSRSQPVGSEAQPAVTPPAPEPIPPTTQPEQPVAEEAQESEKTAQERMAEVQTRLEEYKDRILMATNEEDRQVVIEERYAYIGKLITDGNLRMDLGKFSNHELMNELTVGYDDGLTGADLEARLASFVDAKIEALMAEGKLTPESEAVVRAEIEGLIEVGRFIVANQGVDNYEDEYERQRMAYLPIRVVSDRGRHHVIEDVFLGRDYHANMNAGGEAASNTPGGNGEGNGGNGEPPAENGPEGQEDDDHGNELLARMGLGSLDEITDESIRALVGEYGVMEMNALTAEDLKELRRDIASLRRGAMLKSGETFPFNKQEAMLLMNALDSWILEFEERQKLETGGAGGFSAQAEANLSQMAEDTRRAREYAERQSPVVERILPPENKESVEDWIAITFAAIDRAEQMAEEIQELDEDEINRAWRAAARLVESMPSGIGHRDEVLSEYFASKHPEGVLLKEKLSLLVTARRRLTQRYIESIQAGGSLTSYGVDIEATRTIKEIAPKLQDIEPVDWYVLVHSDDMFRRELANSQDVITARSEAGEETRVEKGEILANIDDGLCMWWDIGIAYDKRVGRLGNTYSFKDTLNDAHARRNLRYATQERLGNRKGSQVAERMLTVTWTMAFFDKERESRGGKGEERDLIWFNVKSKENMVQKGRDEKIRWTRGRYFALFGQGILNETAKRILGENADEVATLFAINAERAAFPPVSPLTYSEGSVVSDWFHTTKVNVVDELKLSLLSEDKRRKSARQLIQEGHVRPEDQDRVDELNLASHLLYKSPEQLVQEGEDITISRKLVSWAVDRSGKSIRGGWKQIPFLRLTESPYKGYFSYHVGLARNFVETFESPEKAIDDRTKEDWLKPSTWQSVKTGLSFIKDTAPVLLDAEFRMRGVLLANQMYYRWGYSQTQISEWKQKGVSAEDREIAARFLQMEKLKGYSASSDLRVITDPGVIRDIQSQLAEEGFTAMLVESAKKNAARYVADQLDHLGMLVFLGKVWQGSKDAIEGYGGPFKRSPIEQYQVQLMIEAAAHPRARLLNEEAEKQARIEVLEMGYGAKVFPGQRKRYRIGPNGEIIKP